MVVSVDIIVVCIVHAALFPYYFLPVHCTDLLCHIDWCVFIVLKQAYSLDRSSVTCGWQLMWLATGCFAPSTNLLKEVTLFLRTQSQDIAEDCLNRLQKILKLVFFILISPFLLDSIIQCHVAVRMINLCWIVWRFSTKDESSQTQYHLFFRMLFTHDFITVATFLYLNTFVLTSYNISELITLLINDIQWYFIWLHSQACSFLQLC